MDEIGDDMMIALSSRVDTGVPPRTLGRLNGVVAWPTVRDINVNTLLKMRGAMLSISHKLSTVIT